MKSFFLVIAIAFVSALGFGSIANAQSATACAEARRYSEIYAEWCNRDGNCQSARDNAAFLASCETISDEYHRGDFQCRAGDLQFAASTIWLSRGSRDSRGNCIDGVIGSLISFPVKAANGGRTEVTCMIDRGISFHPAVGDEPPQIASCTTHMIHVGFSDGSNSVNCRDKSDISFDEEGYMTWCG